jgi:hypothetical protein
MRSSNERGPQSGHLAVASGSALFGRNPVPRRRCERCAQTIAGPRRSSHYGQPTLEWSITKQDSGEEPAQTVRRDPLRQLRAEPGGDRLGRGNARPHRQIDRPAYCVVDPSAATIVAGALTTTPTAAARPMLLCIGSPDNAITMLVRMPPPTPAKPETIPIASSPATWRNEPFGDSANSGRKRPGAAKRAAATNVNRAKAPVITLPRTHPGSREPSPGLIDIGTPTATAAASITGRPDSGISSMSNSPIRTLI